MKLLLISLAACLFSVPVQGQESPDRSQEAGADSTLSAARANASKSGTSNPSSEDASTIPDQLQVPKLGSAEWLQPGVHSPIHLGPVYLPSASFSFLSGGALTFNQALNQFETETQTAAVFSAPVNYDKLWRSSRLTFQYSPQLAVVDGSVQSNLSNQYVTLSTSRILTPRLSIAVSDNFSSMNGQLLYSSMIFDMNSVSGQTLQTPFLQNSQQWINNTVTLSTNYRLSSRDSIGFSPYFQYQQTNNAGFTTASADQSYTYGGQANLSHMLSATDSVGLYVGVSNEQFSSVVPTTLYESFGMSYAHRLSATWLLQSSAGVGTSLAQGGRTWTPLTSISLGKTLESSSLAFAFFRVMNLGPELTNGYSNRADVRYSRTFMRHLQGNVAVSYQSNSGGSPGTSNLSGTYTTGQLNHHLSRSLTWYFGYSKLWEKQLVQGSSVPSQTFTMGITWAVTPTDQVISPVRF